MTGKLNTPDISMYVHCKKCIAESKVKEVSPSSYSHLAVGFTKEGSLQVWCEKHHEEVATFRNKVTSDLQDAVLAQPPVDRRSN